MWACGTHRCADVLCLKRAGSDLGQHWGEEQVIALADQGDFEIVVLRDPTFQSLSSAHATESAPQDDDPADGDRRRIEVLDGFASS